MSHSMTAFARVQTQLDSITLCWEVKSVNHRYLDVSFRLPDTLRFLETELRALLRQKIHRGKVECQLKIQENNLTQPHLTINEGLMDSLLAISDKLASSKKLKNDVTVSTFMSWPEIIKLTSLELEHYSNDVLQLFDNAMTQLVSVRATEGMAIANFIRHHVQTLQEEIKKAKALSVANGLTLRDKLLKRLNLIQSEIDTNRIEQEVAFMLTKLDINEELERLATHGEDILNVLNNGIAMGRRLDFLMQELNREANTLGSKSDSAALTQCAIEMKVVIEQMREQIQNIE